MGSAPPDVVEAGQPTKIATVNPEWRKYFKKEVVQYQSVRIGKNSDGSGTKITYRIKSMKKVSSEKSRLREQRKKYQSGENDKAKGKDFSKRKRGEQKLNGRTVIPRFGNGIGFQER